LFAHRSNRAQASLGGSIKKTAAPMMSVNAALLSAVDESVVVFLLQYR
jgi:hypothetical protein